MEYTKEKNIEKNAIEIMSEKDALSNFYDTLSDNDVAKTETLTEYLEENSFEEAVYLPENNENVEEFEDYWVWYVGQSDTEYVLVKKNEKKR